MRYAIFSDLHANRQALEALLADFASADIDSLLFLGDAVGYGPSPSETMARLYEHVSYQVLGNHDAVLAGILDAGCFIESARLNIEWTGSQLGKKAVSFFRGLPLIIEAPDFACAHANFHDPGRFDYLDTEEQAAASWQASDKPLLFVGHSHVAELWVQGASGLPHQLCAQDFELEAGKRYIVNVGAAGLPRDHDLRSSYVIYDDARHAVYFRRVPFDFQGYRDDVERVDCPGGQEYFLKELGAHQLVPLRERVDFRPLSKKEDAVQLDVKQTAMLTRISESRRKWKIMAVSSLLVLVAVLLSGGWGLSRFYTDEVVSPIAASMRVLERRPLAVGEMISIPISGKGVVAAIPGSEDCWNVDIAQPGTIVVSSGNSLYQEKAPDKVFRIESADPNGWVELRSFPVTAQKGCRYCIKSRIFLQEWSDSCIAFKLMLLPENGAERELLRREPGKPARGRTWSKKQLSGTIPKSNALKESGELYVVLEIRGAGTMEAGDFQLFCLDD